MEISGWGILKTVISLYDVAHGILKHASQHPHIDIHVLVLKKHHNPLIHYLYWCNMTAPDWCDCISVLKHDFCDCFSVSKDTSHCRRMWPWWWIKACPCWILVKKNPCQRVQKTKHKFKNKKLVPLKFRRITLYMYTLYYFHVASKAS